MFQQISHPAGNTHTHRFQFDRVAQIAAKYTTETISHLLQRYLFDQFI